MPYTDISQLPPYIKKYSSKIQRMFMKTWMSVYSSSLKKGMTEKEAEVRAFQIANGIVKKNIESHSASHYGYDDHMKYLVDKFLGNM